MSYQVVPCVKKLLLLGVPLLAPVVSAGYHRKEVHMDPMTTINTSESITKDKKQLAFERR